MKMVTVGGLCCGHCACGFFKSTFLDLKIQRIPLGPPSYSDECSLIESGSKKTPILRTSCECFSFRLLWITIIIVVFLDLN